MQRTSNCCSRERRIKNCVQTNLLKILTRRKRCQKWSEEEGFRILVRDCCVVPYRMNQIFLETEYCQTCPTGLARTRKIKILWLLKVKFQQHQCKTSECLGCHSQSKEQVTVGTIFLKPKFTNLSKEPIIKSPTAAMRAKRHKCTN